MSDNKVTDEPLSFEKELSRLPLEIVTILKKKEKKFSKFVEVLKEKSKGKDMGVFITPHVELKDNVPKPDFNKLTLNFLYDDFDKPLPEFNPRLYFGKDFDSLLVEEKVKNPQTGQEEVKFVLVADKNISFFPTTVQYLRENCFDGIYDDMKRLGSSIVYYDTRGFISALKTIDIHRNMLLQKFEKYVVVYAGAGSWLRGEKSNDFDVFVVIDDTDVKRMPRLQVKDQLTKIIWQMSREIAQVTGIQIHIQVYLLTDFWDALKDAHPVMFTFLRDGVPFYDRGIYGAWKELLKLGKIKPSSEAIDLHMNAGTQLVDRARKMFNEIAMNDVYYAFLNPAQAVLMMKGFNPTTPKETLKIFKEVLVDKDKVITQKDYDNFEEAVKLFKSLEHDKDTKVSGKDLDRMLKNADGFLAMIKKMFDAITEDKTKDSFNNAYSEFISQISQLSKFDGLSEKDLVKTFESEYVDSGRLPSFTKDSIKSIRKAKIDFDKKKITSIEVNKVLKEIRNLLSELKSLRDANILIEANSRKLSLIYDDSKSCELFMFDNKIYLIDFSSENIFEFKAKKFVVSKVKREDLVDNSKLADMELTGMLIDCVKDVLKAKSLKI
jgi:uncharacterized protein (UPF0332 family)